VYKDVMMFDQKCEGWGVK